MGNPNPDTSGLIRSKKGDPAPKGAGRPKGAIDKKKAIARVLNLPIEDLLDPNDMPKWLRKQNPKTVYEAMNARMALEAIRGDSRAYNALSKALGEDINVSVKQMPKPILAGMSNQAKELNASVSSDDSDDQAEPAEQED